MISPSPAHYPSVDWYQAKLVGIRPGNVFAQVMVVDDVSVRAITTHCPYKGNSLPPSPFRNRRVTMMIMIMIWWSWWLGIRPSKT